MSAITLRKLSPADPVEYEDLLRIYMDSIPSSEQKSAETIHGMLDDANYNVVGAFDGAKLIGFSMLYTFLHTKLRLLEYMAVSKSRRGEGIGSRLFDVTVNDGQLEIPTILEVDSEIASSPAYQQQVSRKEFYRKLGCREIAGFTYILPLEPNPPPMNILLHGWSGGSIPKTRVISWLESIYCEVYAVAQSDPRLLAMASTLPPEVMLV